MIYDQKFNLLTKKRIMKSIITLIIILISSLYLISEEEKEVKLLTYNVLADHKIKDQRLPSLFEILKKSNANIIALQEVAPWFVEELKKEKWFKNYYVPKKKNKIVYPRGLLILSKEPIEEIEMNFLPSKQRRAYLIVKTKIKLKTFYVATCHLDSFLKDGVMRAKQLDLLFNKLSEHDNAILLGDFNFGDNEMPETNHLNKDFIDVWKVTNKNEVGFTWNIEKSFMAQKGSFPKEKSRRIDRILIKSEVVNPIKTLIVGDKPIQKGSKIFPSDHFGLLSTIMIK
ncbi:MAG: hypothetical protein COA79_24895 [Planctomycetota bacterium]|nr:MAG: hypothetical protein COA79_24895 [Planctomycetota bacterium]